MATEKEKFDRDVRKMSLNLGLTQVETLALLEILGVTDFNTIFTPRNRLTLPKTSSLAEQCFSLERTGYVHSFTFGRGESLEEHRVEFYVTLAGLAAFKWAMLNILLKNSQQP